MQWGWNKANLFSVKKPFVHVLLPLVLMEYRIPFPPKHFENIDYSDSMNNFECNMKFLKTKGFQEVEK